MPTFEDVIFTLGSYWGPETQHKETPCVYVNACVRRRGHKYAARATLYPAGESGSLVTYATDLAPRPRGPRRKAIEADIGAQLRELAEEWRKSDEYVAAYVAWRREALQRALRHNEVTVATCTGYYKRARHNLTVAQRKLKAFNKKHPEKPRDNEIPFG